jgi:formiminotetrahydrofolate cyclodeaminase
VEEGGEWEIGIVLDKTTTIEAFLEGAAAKRPTPGGGAVAALAGALGAAMGEMVLNYSVGKKGLEQYDSELKIALVEFQRAREMLAELMVEDQAAFEAMTAAKKLPGDSPLKVNAAREATMMCIRVPQAMAGTAAAMLELADRMVEKVNVYLLSDLAVCGELAMATVRAGIYNVRVNLPEIRDVEERRLIETTDQQLLQRATVVIQRLIPRIWERVGR